MPADLVVQIVNFNTQEHVARLLPGLLDELDRTPATTEVHVLENGSDDDLAAVRAAFGDRVTFHDSARNRGFGGGHDLLAERTDSRAILFVNPDVEIDRPGVVAGLLAHLRDPAVVAAGPLLRTETGAPQLWDHGELRGIRARVANGAGHAHWRARTAPARAAWCAGAFLLVDRRAFDAVGGFDERFFLFKEEEDLCLQLRRAGGRIVYDPTVSVSHVGGVVADRGEHLRPSIDAYVEKNLPGRRRALLELLYTHVTRRI
jgi:N-acetylglucosaminyl-diphospho-decaprenol L-rhamnosyltransferase